MNVTLHSEQYEVTISSMGAELKSFKDPSTKEFVWTSDPVHWMRSSPLLFPTIGNVRNDVTLFNGKEYALPKHGFCKDSEFEVENCCDTKVTFHLKASEETLAVYPYLFDLKLTYELNKNVLQMTYTVSNADTKEMPYHIGAHPGFLCPLEEGEDFRDYHIVFEKEENLLATPYNLENLSFHAKKQISYGENTTTLSLTKEMFAKDAVFFPEPVSRSVKLVSKETGHGIQVDYPGFKSVAFWTPMNGKAPFLCIEPWNGQAIYEDEDDNFTNKRNVEWLAPGESKQYHLTISLLGY